jgi:ribonuclease HI
VAAVTSSPTGQELHYAAHIEFPCTNNVAVYEALILGQQMVAALGAGQVWVQSDSQVVTMQVEKEYEARETELVGYLRVVLGLEKKFQGFTVTHIPQSEKTVTDALATPHATLLHRCY